MKHMEDRNTECSVAASPILIFVVLEEFVHLLTLEVVLVLVVAGYGVHFVDAVVLLQEELLERQHHLPRKCLRGGVWGFSGNSAMVTGHVEVNRNY